ncbi:hypothetical protein Tco_0880194 [Tanacetum coccineum]
MQQVPEQVHNQSSSYVAEGFDFGEAKRLKKRDKRLIAKAEFAGRRVNIQASKSRHIIENCYSNVIPSQVDAFFSKLYVLAIILHVHLAHHKHLLVPEQQKATYQFTYILAAIRAKRPGRSSMIDGST